jgi:signal transduction histidine kinase
MEEIPMVKKPTYEELEKKVKEIEKEASEYKRAKETLRLIFEGTVNETEEDFLRSLVRHIASVIGFRWVFVGEVISPGVDRIRTLTVWADGDYAENFEYDLTGTPCENVVKQSFRFYPKGVQQKFPEDHLLVEMGVESYMGIPLIDSSGTTIGNLVALHDKSMEKLLFSKPILTIFAERVVTEIERKRTDEMLKRKQHIQSVLNAMLNIALKPYSLEEMLSYIVKYIISIPWLTLESKAAVFLVEDQPNVLVIKCYHEFSKELRTMCAQIPFGKCLCGRAASTKKIIFADCINHHHENKYKGMSPHGHYCVPILSSDKVLGVLTLYVKEGYHQNKEEENFLFAIANVLAGIIKRKQIEIELAKYRKHLEELVKERTAELTKANKFLKQEITEHKQAEKELRNLSIHLQSVKEKERANIAREIHDELGQLLTVLQMGLSDLAMELPQEKKSLVEKTKEMSKIISKSLQTVQKIFSNLRPNILDDLGIISAIELHAEEFQAHTGIKCMVTYNTEDIILDKDHATMLYRIFQEALTNVARHANATRVKANLKKAGDRLIIKIIDNGIGITKKEAFSSKSIGIIGIRERAHFLGGTVKVVGTKDKGTSLTVSIPFSGKEKSNDKSTYS